MTYLVFDAPKCAGDFETRMAFLRSVISAEQTPYARVVGHIKCKGEEHLQRTLAEVENVGGEGLMLRQAHSPYEYTRSKCLLKVKTFFDEEARVIGYKQGQGKNAGKMGHLVCETPDKRVFHVGGGFTDKQREHPPKIGSVITYKYFELSAKLIPRFPIFIGVRLDIDWNDYCKNYKIPTKKKPAALRRSHTILFSDVPNLAGATPIAASSGASSLLVQEPPKPSKPEAKKPAEKKKSDDEKPPCKYGAQCYRTNPEHLAKYSHPKPEPAKKVDISKLPAGTIVLGNGTVYIPTDDKVAPPTLAVTDVPATISDPQLSPMAVYEDDDAVDVACADPEADEEEEQEEESSSQPDAKRPRKEQEMVDGKPVCKYGEKCFRKNPEHLAKYYHPPRPSAPAAAAAAVPDTEGSFISRKTVVMPDFIPKTDPKQTRVALVDIHSKTSYELDEGVNSIGRGFAGILDMHVSRRQMDVIVATSPDPSVIPDVIVVARGMNPCMVLPAGASADDSSAWRKLDRDVLEHVHENDTLSLLSDKSAAFTIKFIKSQ